jgi:XTP/dITP diphosphohydrolase
MNKINFITSNKGKVKSLENSLKSNNLEVYINAQNLDIMEPQFDTVQEVSKFKALKAFEMLKEPVLVEDGGFSVFELNGFPGVYTKYVLKTLGADGILKLMNGIQNRIAKFISVATFVDEDGNIIQFEREGGEFEISKEKIDIQSPFAWSELWKIIYLKEYNKNLCELSEQEVSEYYGHIGSNGSIQKFVKWYVNEYKR